MQKRTLVRSVVFFVVSVALVATAAHAVLAQDDNQGDLKLPPGDGKTTGIGGSGTLNYIPKFVGSTTLGNSVLYELGGNVGIGTTQPSARLDIVPANNIGLRLGGADQGALIEYARNNGAYNFFTGIPNSADSVWQIQDNDHNPIFTANYNGNVGIGTTSPSQKLDVVGIIYSGKAKSNIPLDGEFMGSNGYWTLRTDTNNKFNLDVYNDSSPIAAMTVLNTGNVGIGTTEPGVKIDIAGGFRASGIWDMPPTAYFRGNEATGYRFNNAADTLNLLIITDAGAVSIPNGTLTVSGAGNSSFLGSLGIGTANPSQKLDVAGYIKGQTGLCIGDDCRTSWPSGSGGNITGSGSTNYLAKFTGSTSIGNGAIYDNGNVGIGTTSPSATLHVSGTQRIDSSTTGNALYIASSGSGSHALRAKANSIDAGAAIYAETASGNNSSAVWAKSGATTIYGETWGEGFAGGSDIGVHGLAASSTSTGGATLGVLGESHSIPDSGSDTSNGVFGWGRIGGAYGRTYGVWGETDSKGPPNGQSGPVSGVTGVASDNVSGLQSMGVVGRTSRASSSSFGVFYQGGLSGTGSISSIVRTDSGPRLIYATQSPEPWVEDYGEAQMKNGYVRISLDSAYLQTVALDASHPFHVFVTPTGTASLNGLRVIKDATGFRVQELNGGKSSGTFDWRIAAKRKDLADRRLDISEGAYSDPTLYPERFPNARLTHEGLQTVQPQE